MKDKFNRNTEFLIFGFSNIHDDVGAFDHGLDVYEDVRDYIDADRPEAGTGDWSQFDEDPVWCCTNIMTLCVETLQSLTRMEAFEIAQRALLQSLGSLQSDERDEVIQDLESLFDFHGGAQ